MTRRAVALALRGVAAAFDGVAWCAWVVGSHAERLAMDLEGDR